MRLLSRQDVDRIINGDLEADQRLVPQPPDGMQGFDSVFLAAVNGEVLWVGENETTTTTTTTTEPPSSL